MNPIKEPRRYFGCSIKEFVVRILFFVLATLVALYTIPREGRFRYIFSEGKPWKYGLLTAPYDFPIYKETKILNLERDSIMRLYQPYFQLDTMVGKKYIDNFLVDFRALNSNGTIPKAYATYVVNRLQEAYSLGIMASSVRDDLQKQRVNSLFLIKGKEGVRRMLNSFSGEKETYENVALLAPEGLNKGVLQQLDVSRYISANVVLDEARSQIAKDELLKKVPYATGMVQAGERIIDRGEIVTKKTYNILSSLETDMKQRKGAVKKRRWFLAGEFVLLLTLFGCMFFYLLFFRIETFRKKRLLLFILLMIVGMTAFASLFAIRSLDSIYMVPFAIVPLVIRTFFDSRTALFAHIITVLTCSIMVSFPYEFTLMQLTIGMVAIFSLKDLTQRSQVVRSAIIIFLAYSIIYLGFSLLQEGDITKVKSQMYINFAINGVLLLFTYLLIFVVEKLFGFVSNVTLVELSNINSPILRRFSEECPGTFQHSMQVANLAAAAAGAINANVQLARTGALYHDIGKMKNPVFFTENQSGVNPHDQLSCEESAKIIIGHVENGVKIAHEIKLPETLIDFIRMHHGKGKAKYFYNRYCNEHPDEEVDEQEFSYPGPLPYSRETTILMMADTVEATSRSMKEYTEESILAMVERSIDAQMADGLFKDSRLSFRDVETVKRVFVEKLKNIYHTRISYPELMREQSKN